MQTTVVRALIGRLPKYIKIIIYDKEGQWREKKALFALFPTSVAGFQATIELQGRDRAKDLSDEESDTWRW